VSALSLQIAALNEILRWICFISFFSVENLLLEAHWHEHDTKALEELVLELNPMKTEGVESALEERHAVEDTEGRSHKHIESEEETDDVASSQER